MSHFVPTKGHQCMPSASSRCEHLARTPVSNFLCDKNRHRCLVKAVYLICAIPGARAHLSSLRLGTSFYKYFPPPEAYNWVCWFLANTDPPLLPSTHSTHLLTCVIKDSWFNGAVFEIGVSRCNIFKIAFIKECVLEEYVFKVHLCEPVGEMLVSEWFIQGKKRDMRPKWKTQKGKIRTAWQKVLEHYFQIRLFMHFLAV